MEAEMQTAGRRALQAQGTAGVKALRQDPTRQTRQKQQGPLELRGRGRRAGDRLAGVRPAGPLGLVKGRGLYATGAAGF